MCFRLQLQFLQDDYYIKNPLMNENEPWIYYSKSVLNMLTWCIDDHLYNHILIINFYL